MTEPLTWSLDPRRQLQQVVLLHDHAHALGRRVCELAELLRQPSHRRGCKGLKQCQQSALRTGQRGRVESDDASHDQLKAVTAALTSR